MAAQVLALEPAMAALSDAQLTSKTLEFRARLSAEAWTLPKPPLGVAAAM